MIPFTRAKKILTGFSNQKILVYGDVILDRYIFGSVNRISPEAPVPVLALAEEVFKLGGAGNVAANIDSLGGQGILMGVSGDDIFSAELDKLKPRHNFIRHSPGLKTIVKTRVIASRQQLVRIDREGPIALSPAVNQSLSGQIAELDVKGIIVSDYGKGTLNKPIMECLARKSKQDRIPLVVDPKPPHFKMYQGISGITPNLKEAQALCGFPLNSAGDFVKAVNYIRKKFRSQFALITLGDRGMIASGRGEKVFRVPARSQEVFDVTGAGDTVVAVLTLSLISGATLREGVELANAAASIVVEHVGTRQVTREEVLKRHRLLAKQ